MVNAILCALMLASSTSALYSSKDKVLQLNKATYGPTVMKTMVCHLLLGRL
jgi:hypothetical protein